MKKLILSALLVTSSAFAQEIVERRDTNQIASTVKDLEVKELLEQTSEFRECRDMYPFDAKDGQRERSDKIQKAQDCFKKKLGSGSSKSAEELGKLSDKLDLQSYDLVKSKNAKDIQKFLDDKMYESMTGVKPDLKRAELQEALKFNKKKHIDQKMFLTLWKTQLVKNSLFMISNYCLTKFRKTAPYTGNNTFGEYWKGFKVSDILDSNGKVITANLANFSDSGSPEFGNFTNAEDKDKIYGDLLNSMKVGDSSAPFPTSNLSDFFFACGKTIAPMCDEFKKNLNLTTATSAVADGGATAASSTSPGSAACLVRARLEEYKKALADTAKYEDAFAQMQADGKTEQMMAILQKGETKNIFGKGPNDESLDNLTNYTSTDFIGNADKDSKLEKCNTTPDDAECEKYFTGKNEDFLKAQESVETEMTLKREVEMARVRELKGKNDAKLDEYLEQNGFYDILKNYKDQNWSADKIAEEVGKAFEAKKIAVLDEMKVKLGARQIKEGDGAAEKKAAVQAGVKATKEERARLAQVVLFNNIITSHLSVERDLGNGKREAAGRNVNAFNKEAQALTNAQVDASLFQNLKAQGEAGQSQVGQNDQLGGITLIEEMLGKEKKP